MIDVPGFRGTYPLLLLIVCFLTVLWCRVQAQSCGPRVSARLLAEIPCDMSKTSYCSAPGSAYPWSSVKRYIIDNQGLVRRMYGDEKHSSVLLNEIDGFRSKFESLRETLNSMHHSRMEYGRSARNRPTRRQPRPQKLFTDEPSTIFRVVTETSIKVGEAITAPIATITSTTEQTIAPRTTTAGTTTTTTPTTEPTETTEEPTTSTTTETTWTTEETSTTAAETTTTAATTTTTVVEAVPVAMRRTGLEERDPPRKKSDYAAAANSVEEKTERDKHEETEDLIAEASEEEEVREENKAAMEEEAAAEEEEEEEIPRRGINACPVKNEVIAPYWANNTRGETLALLNVYPFEQYVHFEKCAYEHHQMLCREGCRCEQQYRLHRLLAFDPKNECRGIFSDWFRFPSCCVCICYDLTPDIPRARRRKGRMK